MFGLNNMAQNDNPEKGCMDYVKEYWAKIPFWNRFLMLTLIILYILCWVYPLEETSANNLVFTVYARECKFYIIQLYSLEGVHCSLCASKIIDAFLCPPGLHSDWLYSGKSNWNFKDDRGFYADEFDSSNYVFGDYVFVVLCD